MLTPPALDYKSTSRMLAAADRYRDTAANPWGRLEAMDAALAEMRDAANAAGLTNDQWQHWSNQQLQASILARTVRFRRHRPRARLEVQGTTVKEALAAGLRERLERAPLTQGPRLRSVAGYSPSTGARYHALLFNDTQQVLVLLLPERGGAAGDVDELPGDVVWPD